MYYATMVMHNIDHEPWDVWNRKMGRLLVQTQNIDPKRCARGSWDPAGPTKDQWGDHGGRLMTTSLSALTLEVYYRYLPRYSLDGPPASARHGDRAEVAIGMVVTGVSPRSPRKAATPSPGGGGRWERRRLPLQFPPAAAGGLGGRVHPQFPRTARRAVGRHATIVHGQSKRAVSSWWMIRR